MYNNKKDELIIGAGAVRGGAGEYFMNGIRRKNGRRTEHYKGVDTGFSCGLGGCQEVEPFAAATRTFQNSRARLANMRASIAPVGTMPSESGVVRRSPMQASGNLAADLLRMRLTDPVESQQLAAKSDMIANTDLSRIVDQKVYQAAGLVAKREGEPYKRREMFTGQKMKLEEEPYRRRVAGQQRVPVRRVERFTTGTLAEHSKEIETFNRRRENMTMRQPVVHQPRRGRVG